MLTALGNPLSHFKINGIVDRMEILVNLALRVAVKSSENIE